MPFHRLIAKQLVGKPGIGKTDIAEQVAAQVGAHLVKSHPALDDITDGKGFPWMFQEDGQPNAQFVPIGQFKKVLEARTPTIWFLDDFLQAPDTVQKTYMQWLHGRECAGHRLPDCVQILVATNDRTHRAGAGGMLEPIKSRCTIVELVEDFDEWSAWLFQQDQVDGVPLSVDLIAEQVAFLRFRPEVFCKFEPNTDLHNSPNPRTWVKALKWLTQKQSAEAELAALAGVVGEGAATERLAFRRMYRELPKIESILMDPDAVAIPTNPAVLYAVARALAHKATEANFGRVARYTERLVEVGHGEFATLLLREATRNTPDLQNTPTFVKLTQGEIGELITGSVS